MGNYFELLGLPERYQIDLTALDAAYHRLQHQVHPDRFAHTGPAEQRVALQWATQVNSAYQTLRNPLQRAIYLCEQRGVELQAESNTAMPVEFLMQQIEWREQLDAAQSTRNAHELDQLQNQWRSVYTTQVAQIAELLDVRNDPQQAAQPVRQLMFLEKFGAEIERVFEMIES